MCSMYRQQGIVNHNMFYDSLAAGTGSRMSIKVTARGYSIGWPVSCYHFSTYSHVHTVMYIQSCTYSYVHTVMYIQSCTYSHVHTVMYIQSCTYSHVHTVMYIQSCTYSHVHTVMYIQSWCIDFKHHT